MEGNVKRVREPIEYRCFGRMKMGSNEGLGVLHRQEVFRRDMFAPEN
jgi:hypothetical protein